MKKSENWYLDVFSNLKFSTLSMDGYKNQLQWYLAIHGLLILFRERYRRVRGKCTSLTYRRASGPASPKNERGLSFCGWWLLDRNLIYRSRISCSWIHGVRAWANRVFIYIFSFMINPIFIFCFHLVLINIQPKQFIEDLRKLVHFSCIT